MKTITVKSDGNGMVMEWNLEGSGRCEAGINNPFLEMCLKSFAEASSIDLKLICSKDIGGEELMGAMGDLFAEAVCKQCMELEEYGGTGSGCPQHKRRQPFHHEILWESVRQGIAMPEVRYL